MKRRNPLLTAIAPALALTLLLAAPACKNSSELDNGDDMFGALVGTSQCKSQTESGEIAFVENAGNECILYKYDGKNILTITHQNTCFNCCPGDIDAETKTVSRTLQIVEKQSRKDCHCLCLFDAEYQFRGVKPGVYAIKISGPYTQNQPLAGTLNLTAAGNGQLCIERNEYPWK